MRRVLSVSTFMVFELSCSRPEVIAPRALTDLAPPPVSAVPPPRASPKAAREEHGKRVSPPPLKAAALDCDRTLLITELLADPKHTRDRQGEYIELFNPGDQPVRLAGWRLGDGDREGHTIAPEGELAIPPHGVLVLGNNADSETNGGVAVDYAYDHVSLSNAADRLRLEDPCGNVVVDLNYPGRTGWPKLKAGRALELVALPGSTGGRWRLSSGRLPSGDSGTPGRVPWGREAAPTNRPPATGSRPRRANAPPTDSRRTAHRTIGSRRARRRPRAALRGPA